MRPPTDIAYARFIRDWSAFIEQWTRNISGRASSADIDDLRQAALMAAWSAWQALPEHERQPHILHLVIPRTIKNAIHKEWTSLHNARASGIRATLLSDYVTSILNRHRPGDGYVRSRLDTTSHTLTALHLLYYGLTQGSTGLVSSEIALIREEARHRLAFAIARLDEDQCALIEGYYFHGRTLKEVGAEFGVHSPPALTRLHHKALDVLRNEMEEFASLLSARNEGATWDVVP